MKHLVARAREYHRRVPQLTVNGRRIADDEPAYVIAEIGHNHQGELEKAKALIHAAKECGVDAVKFQKRDNRRLFTRAFYESPYDNENSFGATYGEHREALELDKSDWFELSSYSREEGVAFIRRGVRRAERGPPGGARRRRLQGRLGRPLERAVPPLRRRFRQADASSRPAAARSRTSIGRSRRSFPLNAELCVLHCTASYPADIEDLNLSVITALTERYPELVIGLSDHHNGIAMAPVAYMLGARAFEKHFTLNHAWKGTDHAYSLMPDGMRRFVRDLQRVPTALGDGVKRRLPSEERPLAKMGKKLVAARDLPAGHHLAPGDVVAKSPADGGLAPYELDRLLGRPLLRPLAFEQDVSLDDVELAEELAARGSREA